MSKTVVLRFGAMLVAASLFSSMPVAAKKPMMKASSMDPTKISSWLGTWHCVQGGKNRYNIIFKPLLGGSAMTVSDTGKPRTEGMATFDSKNKQYFYTAIQDNGFYFSMLGPVSGNTINFKQVAPQGDATLNIQVVSSKKYTDVFSMTQNGKKMTVPETCTR